MAIPCKDCRNNKKKLFFDQERALEAAKKLAIERQETFAIYKQGRAIAYASAVTARANGYDILSLVSFNI